MTTLHDDIIDNISDIIYWTAVPYQDSFGEQYFEYDGLYYKLCTLNNSLREYLKAISIEEFEKATTM